MNEYERIIYTGWRVVFDVDAVGKMDCEIWREYYYEDTQRDIGDGVVIIELFTDGSGEIQLNRKSNSNDISVSWVVIEQAIKHFKTFIIPEALNQGYIDKESKNFQKYFGKIKEVIK